MTLSSDSWRRLSLVAWIASVVLILLAAVLLVGFGGEPVDTTKIDLENERDLRNREIPLGTVALVAVAGAAAFAFGGWSRMRSEEVDRSRSASGFGVRPQRSTGTDVPPQEREDHDIPPPDTHDPSGPCDPDDPTSDPDREQP